MINHVVSTKFTENSGISLIQLIYTSQRIAKGNKLNNNKLNKNSKENQIHLDHHDNEELKIELTDYLELGTLVKMLNLTNTVSSFTLSPVPCIIGIGVATLLTLLEKSSKENKESEEDKEN